MFTSVSGMFVLAHAVVHGIAALSRSVERNNAAKSCTATKRRYGVCKPETDVYIQEARAISQAQWPLQSADWRGVGRQTSTNLILQG